jgi:hypothetical protein
LLRGSTLSAAERWLASRPLTAPPPKGNQLELISASQTWAKQRARRWAIGLSGMAIGALSLAGIAYWQRGVAVQQERIAQDQRKSAEEQRNLAEKRRAEALHQQASVLGQLANSEPLRDSALRLASHGTRIDLGLPPDAAKASPAAALAATISEANWRFALRGRDEDVHSAAFNPDGTRNVTASHDNTARIWDTATAKPIAVLRGHVGWVWSAAFSPDGSRIVTASWDKTARIWDVATAKEIVVLRCHDDHVFCAAFSPDGSRIVTASQDNTARI